MPLFPQAFIDDLRLQADIVQVIQEYVPLRRAGATFKGLCPFHAEKTPSFHVNREKGFFHCFGCGVGGDVFKFLELHEKIGFQEAVRHLAGRLGVPVPEQAAEEGGSDAAEREGLLKAHEAAAAWFGEQLRSAAGGRAREQLRARGLSDESIGRLGFGYAPPRRDGLLGHLRRLGFSPALLRRAGLVVERDTGEIVDRFRGRLIVPICRDTGSVVAFAGRAMEPDQQPKYLNSPETPIYVKGRMLYGLHLTKAAIRRLGYVVLVEGYFDFAQVLQAGIGPVVASCGTALTPQQAQLLRRFTTKIILSYDPDAAGQGAAARSSELLVAEGFQVNVALLPAGKDPDVFVREEGASAYLERLRTSQPYLDYLLDRAASAHDLANDEQRRQYLSEMLAVAARIPDPAGRDQFGDRLAHAARITEDVVRGQIRKAAVERRTALTERDLPNFGQVKLAEKGLIWAMFHEPEAARTALAQLEDDDIQGLATSAVLELARGLHAAVTDDDDLPRALLARLNTVEAQLVAGIAAEPAAPQSAPRCVEALKRLRYERQLSLLKDQIDRLQQGGAAADDVWRLVQQRVELARRIEALGA